MHPGEASGPVNGVRPPNGEPESAAGREDPQIPVRVTEIVSFDSSFSIDEFVSEDEAPTTSTPSRKETQPVAVRVPEPTGGKAVEAAALVEGLDATREVDESDADVLDVGVLSSAVARISVSDEPASAPGVLSLAELLENSGPVEWPEAVAIAQHICRAVSRHPAAGAHEYLLDTRHVEITERGEVQILPGVPGGDPLVKQVGRILRALLEGGTAPLQLRLVASQAAFELPGFASIHELSEALRSFERTPESDAIRMAFLRGREAKLFPRVDHDSGPRVDVPAARALAAPIDLPHWTYLVQKTATTARSHRVPLAVLLVVLVGAAAYFSVKWMSVSGWRQLPPQARVETRTPSRAERVEITQPSAATPRPSAPAAPGPTRPPERSRPPIVSLPSVLPELPAVSRPPAESGRPAIEQPAIERDSLPGFNAEKNVFDSIVATNPLYQLDVSRSTPEAVAMLRDSKRSFLPSIARRDYERAREFFEAGDHERALIEGNRVMRMLDDKDIGPLPAGLRDSVEQLLARATVARSREDARVYSVADKSVTPPTAIGRQLPVTPPIGLSHQFVGTLEMIISQEGEVEVIRLHTPLNRYHERMIVSAAKAWRYRPAVKNGKPVKYRLISSINLPES